jgi:hypothetical protein
MGAGDDGRAGQARENEAKGGDQEDEEERGRGHGVSHCCLWTMWMMWNGYVW